MRRLVVRTRAALRLWPLALVAAATLAGALGATAVYRADHHISVGTVRLAVDLGHRGTLDVYMPLVDWGARRGRVLATAVMLVGIGFGGDAHGRTGTAVHGARCSASRARG